jgi:hypothetical protein
MSTVYTNIKNKKLTVETSNTKSPYGTDNKITTSLQRMQLGIFQTFITSGHCIVDLPTAYYRFAIFQKIITRLEKTNSMVK